MGTKHAAHSKQHEALYFAAPVAMGRANRPILESYRRGDVPFFDTDARCKRLEVFDFMLSNEPWPKS